MKKNVKNLRLFDVLRHGKGVFLLRVIHIVFGIALTLFFRRIEIGAAENLPQTGGLIFVSNHPNALVDPALLFIALPRRIAFLAKSTLFKIPVLGLLIRAVGALPLYRQQDAGADVSKNQKTFAVVRELLVKGGAIAIFPEGISHNKPQLQPLKTGAARIALGTVSVGENPSSLELQIVPVGLFYTNKTTFRSEALLLYGAPIAVAPVALDADGQPPKTAVKALTAKIEDALREVTLNAESETQLAAALVAEEVFASFTESENNLAARQEFLRDFLVEIPAKSNAELEKRLAGYDRKLDEFGIEPEFLALADYSKFFIFKQAIVRLWYLILLAPVALIGIIAHFPAYQICKFLAYTQTKKGDFDMASTVKVLAGIVLMPLTWLIIAGVLYYFGFGKVAALGSIPVSFLSGYIALRTLEEIAELSGWANAIILFFRRREKFLRLLAERKNLHEAFTGKIKK